MFTDTEQIPLTYDINNIITGKLHDFLIAVQNALIVMFSNDKSFILNTSFKPIINIKSAKLIPSFITKQTILDEINKFN